MEVVDGRDFSIDYPSDSTEAFIINETAAAQIGFTDDAVGKELELARQQTGRIVGVIKDLVSLPVAW